MLEEMNQRNVPEVPKADTPAKEASPASVAMEVSKRTFDAKDIEENKFITLLSYFWLLSLVPLLVKKESPFAQFHAKQGLALFLVWMAGLFVLLFIPILGWMLMPVLHLAGLVLSVIGIVNVWQGKAWEMPVMKDIVKKLNL